MALSVGMFQRPVEYKASKPYAVFADFTSDINQIEITSHFGLLDKTGELMVDTVIDSGYRFKFLFHFSVYSNHTDLGKRFSNLVKAIYLLKKEVLEGGFYGGTFQDANDYAQAFKSLYPAVIDQVIASVKANEEVIKRSESYKWSLL